MDNCKILYAQFKTNHPTSVSRCIPTDSCSQMNKAVIFVLVILFGRHMFSSWSAEAKVRDYFAAVVVSNSGQPNKSIENNRNLRLFFFYSFSQGKFRVLGTKIDCQSDSFLLANKTCTIEESSDSRTLWSIDVFFKDNVTIDNLYVSGCDYSC